MLKQSSSKQIKVGSAQIKKINHEGGSSKLLFAVADELTSPTARLNSSPITTETIARNTSTLSVCQMIRVKLRGCEIEDVKGVVGLSLALAVTFTGEGVVYLIDVKACCQCMAA